MKRLNLRGGDSPEFFLPYAQALVHRPTLVMRVAGSPATYFRTLDSTLFSLDPEAPVFDEQ